MMKFALLCAVLLAVPGVSFAGTGYVPHFHVNPSSTDSDGTPIGVYTALHVSNIAPNVQSVTITLRHASGEPLAAYPVMVWIASAGPYEMTTDASGVVQFSLAPMASVDVQLQPGASAVSGWATIAGSSNFALIAGVAQYGKLPADGYPGAAYSVSYVVNGGAPF